VRARKTDRWRGLRGRGKRSAGEVERAWKTERWKGVCEYGAQGWKGVCEYGAQGMEECVRIRSTRNGRVCANTEHKERKSDVSFALSCVFGLFDLCCCVVSRLDRHDMTGVYDILFCREDVGPSRQVRDCVVKRLDRHDRSERVCFHCVNRFRLELVGRWFLPSRCV
jgi:hypothetical protein